MILITGLPSAGKTTYSKKYDNVLHYDDVKGRYRRDMVVEAVKADNSLIVEGVYHKAKLRRQLVEVSKENNCCIWFNIPVEECLERERNTRKRGDFQILQCAAVFEPPTFDEGWDEIIIIRGDNDVECCSR